MRLSRRQKLFWAVVVLFLGGYLATKFGTRSGAASPEFKNARYQGAVIAQDIVNLSNNLSENLDEVSRYDRARDYSRAMNLTASLIQKNLEIKQKAVELSAQLEKMTGALATINSQDARASALNSISNHLAIIGRLLSYSDYLAQLLGNLQNRFTGLPTTEKVSTLIAQINAEITAINNFNREAGQAMERFDDIVENK